MKIEIPEYVKKIMNILNANGFETFVVGGCVRDSLMGKNPSDWDMCTNAKPDEMTDVFAGKFTVIPTGLKHGTVTVISDKKPVEITAYRTDGIYEDLRRPKTVTFVGKIQDDLKRRDFTVNAMAYNDTCGLIDMFGGKEDIENKVIRFVGEPKQRIKEDALRIMRALRFSATCGFCIDRKTGSALLELRDLLLMIAKERILSEFKKTITADGELNVLSEHREIFETVYPEIFNSDVFSNEKIKLLINLPKEFVLRLSALVCGLDECRVKTFLKRIKCDKKTVKAVIDTIGYDNGGEYDRIRVKKELGKYNEEYFKILEFYKVTDEKNTEKYAYAQKAAREVIENNECFKVSQLDITGNDLSEIDIKGKEIGKAIETALNAVISDEIPNNKNNLLEYIKKQLIF